VKLSSFIAGAFGTVGFGLSVLSGMLVDNTLEQVLANSLVCAVVCYVVGYVVGVIAQQVSQEHATHVAKMVAEQDAKIAREQAEAAAAQMEPEAGVPATAVPGQG